MTTFWTHVEHGQHKVRVVQEPSTGRRRFHLEHREQGLREFRSFRRLMLFVGGRGSEHFPRYAGLNRQPRERNLKITTLELFRKPPGIDLAARGGEVAKIFFAGFGHWVSTAGFDPEETLQEVYKGILIRNRGAGAWDPRKSSFGSYVHMVCQSVLSNYAKKSRKVRLFTPEEDIQRFHRGRAMHHVDSSSRVVLDDFRRYIYRTHEDDAELLCQVLPLVYGGKRRREVAEALGVSLSRAGKLLSALREVAGSYFSSGHEA